jgi:two-component system, NarL family, response regulator NreC
MIRLLIVEDHELVRDALATLLGQTPGMNVVGVASGVAAALPLLEREDPDVVLADLSLEDGSAIELVRAARRASRKARVLILTAFSETFVAAEALAAGADGYVLKSQSSAELVEAVAVVAGGNVYVAPSVAAHLPTVSGSALVRGKRGSGLQSLSRREQQVFLQAAAGYSSKEIARRLVISPKTVEAHRTHINRKLAVKTSAQLVRFALAHGIVVTPRPVAEPSAADGSTDPAPLR